MKHYSELFNNRLRRCGKSQALKEYIKRIPKGTIKIISSDDVKGITGTKPTRIIYDDCDTL
jgi:hypothetical protein